uniref:uncharacterized protein LOC120326447 n=1 Tax=Styela clava TaxID=7725 RepID=UPI00193A8A79|nr:uncharacterized protein LOC120326447 [Styela clava]
MKKLAILKEVLYDHDDLNEVLKRVDNTMSSVKTIFHEAPYRKSGHPNVTLAPGSKMNPGNGPVLIQDEPTTQMSLLSESVMDKQALNEEELSSEEDDCEEEKFESKVDYERFLNVLRESLNKSVVPPKNNDTGDELMTPVNNGKKSSEFNAALNCTEEVKRTMSRLESQSEAQSEDYPQKKIDATIKKMTASKIGADVKKNQPSVSFSIAETTIPPPRANISTSNMTYENLQEAMASVASNISEIENRRGNQSDTSNLSIKCDGLAGFTATLIDAVTRLTVYVNEAESKQIESESHIEELKDQSDHQRALLDALTAELMSSQEQIKTLKDDYSNQQEESKKLFVDFKQEMQKEMDDLKDQLEQLKKQKDENVNGAGDATSNKFTAPSSNLENIQIIEGGGAKSDKDHEEEALKSDMLSLLGALKAQNSQPEHQVPTVPISSMNHQSSKGAAQTVASVESQLRHLQLQHAEAQNRLHELTEVAGFLAGKVAESERSQSSASSCKSGPVTPASSSSRTPSIVSGPITPRQEDNEFHPMIPSHGANETDDSISGITITSSMFANTGGDTTRPSIQSSGINQLTTSPLYSQRVADDTNSSKSIDCVNISDNSYLSLDKNIPALLQSNIHSFGRTQISQPFHRTKDNLVPPFRPTAVPDVSKTVPQTVSNSILQTQCNLEDRIAELNRQHAEAQSRLQNLIRKRSDVRSPSSQSSGTSGSRKFIQVTLPSDDMLKTPKIYNPPQPFRPYNLTEDSFV